MPVGESPDSSDDGADVELAAGEKSEDAFPDRPVVAEASLEGDVFLNQLIEIESERLWSPADLADPAGGADQTEGDFQSRTGSGGIDDAVASEAVAFHRPGSDVADDDFAAVALRDFEAVSILFESDDSDLSTAEFGDGGAKNSDGAGAENDDAVAGLDVAVVDDGVVGDATRFGEAGLFEGEGIGHAVKDSGWDANKAGHGAIETIAEALACRVEIVETASTHGVVVIDDSRRFRDDTITFLPIINIRAEFDNVSAEFVTEDDGVIDRPGMIGGPLVEIASADANVGDFKEDFVGTDGGTFDFSKLD